MELFPPSLVNHFHLQAKQSLSLLRFTNKIVLKVINGKDTVFHNYIF